jgi:hypothetical protein
MKIVIAMIIISISLWADFSRDNSTQIVTDNSTGLEWQDDVNITKTWQEAIEYCEALALDGGGWRLPNFNELYYIADRSTYNPAMNSTFKNVVTSSYWSSTTYAYNTDNAWVVNFYYGNDNTNTKGDSNYVRCVRARQ